MNRRNRLERLEAGKTATTAIPTITPSMSMVEASNAWAATVRESRFPAAPALSPAELLAARDSYAATLEH